MSRRFSFNDLCWLSPLLLTLSWGYTRGVVSQQVEVCSGSISWSMLFPFRDIWSFSDLALINGHKDCLPVSCHYGSPAWTVPQHI